MNKHFRIGRRRPAIGLTRAASLAEARLIHGGMDGRSSLAGTPTFMLPRKGPASDGERAALRLPRRLPPSRGAEAAKPRKGPRT